MTKRMSTVKGKLKLLNSTMLVVTRLAADLAVAVVEVAVAVGCATPTELVSEVVWK
jgi:hypothetical protein